VQAAVGTPKAASAAAACAALNSDVRVLVFPAVTEANARSLFSAFDLILDCTDSPTSRYLLSDTAAQLRLPLVSGAALRGEGQVAVLCGAAGGAPCRRCLFPAAGASAGGERCADAGVLGPVPGVIGCLQAVEALKLLGGCDGAFTGRLLCYDAFSADRPFYCVHLPPARPSCHACGTQPADPLSADQPVQPPAVISPPINRISVARLAELRASSAEMLLVDVRPRHLYEAAALPGSLSLPFPSDPARVAAWVASLEQLFPPLSPPPLLVLLCRRGRASALAASALAADGRMQGPVVDVEGGLTAWRRHVDPFFPEQQEISACLKSG
jgi:adenylyltransferase and sulfurtransferase